VTRIASRDADAPDRPRGGTGSGNAAPTASAARRPPAAGRRRRIRIGWLDVALLAFVVAGAAYLLHRIDTTLEYNWNWSAVVEATVYVNGGRTSS